MRAQAAVHRDLVLVGGGHAHALVLRMLAMRPLAGLRITLISPDSHTPYSGMLPGLLAGHYRFEQTHIDLQRLCQWAGVRFIAARVTALDPVARRLQLSGRPALDYDVLSIDIGSQPDLDSVPGARAYAIPVKPVADLWRHWLALRTRLDARGADSGHRIAVVGGGAGSVELALAMAHHLGEGRIKVDLYCGAPNILQDYNRRARRSVMAALSRHGVTVRCDARVVRVEKGSLLLADGTGNPYNDLFWCTGASAAPWIASSGLDTDERGFLMVCDTLQAVSDEHVFAAGDIAVQINHPRPKAGVYAVRQGPVLAHNLRALLLSRPLREHRPQRRFLSLISLGGRRASADRGPFSATGEWVWRWKDHIDRKFMSRFENLPASMPGKSSAQLPQLAAADHQQPCGGCGAKVGGSTLSSVLDQLSQAFPEHCAGGGDDAAPLNVPAGQTVLQSLDVLREMVSDPWLMGRIAANHALSDLYACGASPVSALAAVTLPFAVPAILQRELYQLLAGAVHEFAAVGCQLSGGHSMQGPELAVGFAVSGATAGAAVTLGKQGLRVGDNLVLTKPLGTGVLFAGHMQQLADGRDIDAAIHSMLVSNKLAGELAVACGASACTDITGFGLFGHLREMLQSGQAAQLDLAALPLLPGALPLLNRGVRSTMHSANAAARSALSCSARGDVEILFDPQTSGGLLIGVDSTERAESLCDALRQRGQSSAAIIGRVLPAATDADRDVHVV